MNGRVAVAPPAVPGTGTGTPGDDAHDAHGTSDADLERRFGGLERLVGEGAYRRVRAARIAVVGVGGVGSWAAEALARSGVAGLVLVDLDHVGESNINRQVQALGSTLGMAKVQALAARIADIHPGCSVRAVEEFVDASNWPQLLGDGPVDAVIDACDDVRAKTAMAAWAMTAGTSLVVVGAAGGKRHPERAETGDLAAATHDPILAALRQRLRKHHGAARSGPMGIRCVYSREAVAAPIGPAGPVEGSLNCHGYGSSVAVTATFGLVAASLALDAAMLAEPRPRESATL